MSNAGSKKNLSFPMEAVRAEMYAALDALERQKISILDDLQKVYEGGPKSTPFDAEGSWGRLTTRAWKYSWWWKEKQWRGHDGARVARLRELANVLGKARGLLRLAGDVPPWELSGRWHLRSFLPRLPGPFVTSYTKWSRV